MEPIREIDEDAFYGYVERTYFLKGDNLRSLYNAICENLANRSYEEDNSFYRSEGMEARIFSEDDGELKINVYYGNPHEGILIEITSFIGGALLSDKARDLVKVIGEIARENSFKLRNSDRNIFD